MELKVSKVATKNNIRIGNNEHQYSVVYHRDIQY